MKPPITHRKGIPQFCEKSPQEYRMDNYEYFDPMVLRQCAIHLSHDLYPSYPWKEILDFTSEYLPKDSPINIVEIGSGVGRWIAELAQTFPSAHCWGVDYSYQMCKQAYDFWVAGKDLNIDLRKKGFPSIINLKGNRLENLNFGQARATDLPFATGSQDIVVNSFLLDRLPDIHTGLLEMNRILNEDGKLIVITPLNFAQEKQWQLYFPPEKLYKTVEEIGFSILKWNESLKITETLDARGNKILWNCIAFVAIK